MKAKVLLRIAAMFIGVHLLGHSVGHFTWDAPEDAKMSEVVKIMKSYKADFMGATRSMADYYNGYSLMIFGLFGMSIFILWFASGFVNQEKDIAQKVLFPIGLAYMIFGIIEFVYFFPFAASMSFFSGVLIVLSITFVKK